MQKCLVADSYGLVLALIGVAVWARWLPGLFALILILLVTLPMRRWRADLEAVAKRLSVSQRRIRFIYCCGIISAIGGFLFYAIPFGIGTAAFWCIYGVVLLVLAALVYLQYDELFHPAQPER